MRFFIMVLPASQELPIRFPFDSPPDRSFDGVGAALALPLPRIGVVVDLSPQLWTHVLTNIHRFSGAVVAVAADLVPVGIVDIEIGTQIGSFPGDGNGIGTDGRR